MKPWRCYIGKHQKYERREETDRKFWVCTTCGAEYHPPDNYVPDVPAGSDPGGG